MWAALQFSFLYCMPLKCTSVKGPLFTLKCCILCRFEEKQVINLFDKLKYSLRGPYLKFWGPHMGPRPQVWEPLYYKPLSACFLSLCLLCTAACLTIVCLTLLSVKQNYFVMRTYSSLSFVMILAGFWLKYQRLFTSCSLHSFSESLLTQQEAREVLKNGLMSVIMQGHCQRWSGLR